IKGRQSLHNALTRLLEGSTLKFTVVSDTAISIGTVRPEGRQSRNDTNDGTGAEDGSRSPSQSAQPATAESTGAPNGAASSEARLAEIVVTAQKREERLQDVPVPVTAINTESLAQTSQLRLMDYYTQVPG